MSQLAESESSSVTVRAAAKINLHLGVGPVREDGFHPLETVYQAIGLYDDVTVTDGPRWSVHVAADAGIDLGSVPSGEANIAIQAGRALTAHHGLALTATIEIHKGIPVAGGMAGGSADAAATLVALDRLWGLETPDEDLLAIAARLGSDVPFAVGSGRGELVRPVPDDSRLWWVVVPHEIGLSTPGVYRHFDVLAERGDITPSDPKVPDDLLDALEAGEPIGYLLSNDLAPAAYDLRPDLAELRGRLEGLGAEAVLLSGSGPTHLALFEDVEMARDAAARLTGMGILHWLAPAPVAGCHVVELL